MLWSQNNIIAIRRFLSFILAIKCTVFLGCSTPTFAARVPTGNEISLKKSYQHELEWSNAWLFEHARSIKRTQLLLTTTRPPFISGQASFKNEVKILQDSSNGTLTIIADSSGQSLPTLQFKNPQGKTSSLILESLCHTDSCSLDAVRVHPNYPWIALLFDNQENDTNVFLARWSKNGAISIKTFPKMKDIYDISWKLKKGSEEEHILLATILNQEIPLSKVVLWGSEKIVKKSLTPIYFTKNISKSTAITEQSPRQFPIKPKSSRTGLLSIGYGAYGAPVRLPPLPMLSLLAHNGYLIYRTKIAGDDGRAIEGQGLGKLRSAEEYLAETRAISEKYNVKSGQIVALARSAGAIPVLRGVAKEPELFCGVVLEVPFIDPYSLLETNQRDTSHKTTISSSEDFSPDEKAEWLGKGIKSELPVQREILRKISLLTSPPRNLLPPILVISAEDDMRAPVHSLVKLFSHLRRKKILDEESRIVVFNKQVFSHEGPRNRATFLNYQAIIYEFIRQSCKK